MKNGMIFGRITAERLQKGRNVLAASFETGKRPNPSIYHFGYAGENGV
jgi:hypothetical protein